MFLVILAFMGFYCYTQHDATPTQKSAQKCTVTFHNFLRERLQSTFIGQIGVIAPSIKKLIRPGKGFMLPSRFSLKRIFFFFFYSLCLFIFLIFYFLECKQLLKGIIYPLADCESTQLTRFSSPKCVHYCLVRLNLADLVCVYLSVCIYVSAPIYLWLSFQNLEQIPCIRNTSIYLSSIWTGFRMLYMQLSATA